MRKLHQIRGECQEIPPTSCSIYTHWGKKISKGGRGVIEIHNTYLSSVQNVHHWFTQVARDVRGIMRFLCSENVYMFI